MLALLHGGLMHLAANMLFLLVFGSRVNALIGNVKTLILYPLLGVAAALTYMVAEAGGMPMPRPPRSPPVWRHSP